MLCQPNTRAAPKYIAALGFRQRQKPAEIARRTAQLMRRKLISLAVADLQKTALRLILMATGMPADGTRPNIAGDPANPFTKLRATA